MNQSYKYKRIFSCDGGGFRGFLTSLILERVEQDLSQQIGRNGVKIGNYFDLYAGTSTGALISCGLAFGISAKEIKNIYEEKGANIFPDISIIKELRYRWANFLSSLLTGLRGNKNYNRYLFSQPLFDGMELKKVISTIFDETTFGWFARQQKRVMVTAYDCWNSKPVIFDSYKEEHHSLKIIDILMASSAYPGGFPATYICEEQFLKNLEEEGSSIPDDNRIPLVDGGLAANDPAMIALIEGQKEGGEIVLGSFGTGKQILRINHSEAKEMGILDWAFPVANPLLEAVYIGYSKLTEQLIEESINQKDNYFRFQPEVESNNGEDHSPNSIILQKDDFQLYKEATFQYKSKSTLEDIAIQYLQKNEIQNYIDKLVEKLILTST